MLLVILVRPKIYVLQKYDFLIIYIFSISVSHTKKQKKNQCFTHGKLCLTLFTYSHKEIKELYCKKLKKIIRFQT